MDSSTNSSTVHGHQSGDELHNPSTEIIHESQSAATSKAIKGIQLSVNFMQTSHMLVLLAKRPNLSNTSGSNYKQEVATAPCSCFDFNHFAHVKTCLTEI